MSPVTDVACANIFYELSVFSNSIKCILCHLITTEFEVLF